MIAVQCPTRGRTLLSESRIVGLDGGAGRGAAGFTMRVACYCGQRHAVRVPRQRPAADLV